MIHRLSCWLIISLSLLCSVAQAEDLLHSSSIFQPTATVIDGQNIEVRFAIAKGYYLYRDKFSFSAEPTSVRLGLPIIPRGQKKEDENFGQVEVYYKEVLIRLPVERHSPKALSVALNITAQGCADIGICFPPQKQAVSLDFPDLPEKPVEQTSGNESGRIAQLLKNADLWLVVASFFGFGLLLALTPCVFPMIPILSGIIVGSGRVGHGVSHARGFFLSLAYVIGMAITYALAGIAAGLSGTLLSSALQNSWALGGFALIFVALSLSMFGFYELQLPTFLQSKVSEETSHLKGGSLSAVALMGALSAVIVGPCMAAPLAGALLYIGQTGNALLGGFALFFLALGMGVPLLAVGLSAGTLLPKSGAWMVAVKNFFGVVLLATAVWIVKPLIPVSVQMTAWSLLLIVPAMYLHAIDPLPPQAKSGARFWKGIGLIMLIIGVSMMVGVLSGSKDPLQPLSWGHGINQASAQQSQLFERIHSVAELEARIKSSRKPVLLDFYADWCASCKEMERDVFSDVRVQQKLSGWTLLQADVSANSLEDKNLLSRFNLFGPPSIIFFDAQGKEVEKVRLVGLQSTEEFLGALEKITP